LHEDVLPALELIRTPLPRPFLSEGDRDVAEHGQIANDESEQIINCDNQETRHISYSQCNPKSVA
jgi:hypothetical protein